MQLSFNPRMLCHIFWSQVEYKIVCFIYYYYDEGLLIHFYDNFCNESIKLSGQMVRCMTNVLYHLLKKIGKEPNTDLFQFMKEPSHQRTEEEIEFVFKNLGWDYSQIKLD